MKELPRIVSAIVLILLLYISVEIGRFAVFFMICLFSFLVLWELGNNFFKLKTFQKMINHVVMGVLSLIFIFAVENQLLSSKIFLIAGALFNFLLLIYLFNKSPNKIMTKIVKRFPFILGIYVSVCLVSLTQIIYGESWLKYMTLLLLVTYGMDTGGWFFGKNFGKRKLSPSISPNKTIEGLIGGVFFSGVISSAYLNYLGVNLSFPLFVGLCLIAGMTHLGDLAQSKLKREVNIKDSSNLIPGHGGVFDRVDSLYFISPFFVLCIRYFLAF